MGKKLSQAESDVICAIFLRYLEVGMSPREMREQVRKEHNYDLNMQQVYRLLNRLRSQYFSDINKTGLLMEILALKKKELRESLLLHAKSKSEGGLPDQARSIRQLRESIDTSADLYNKTGLMDFKPEELKMMVKELPVETLAEAIKAELKPKKEIPKESEKQ
jgi:hypothetical protein